MMILNYESKKQLRENIGRPLNYTETSFFGPEYTNNGSFCGSNRPSITGNGHREFYATVYMQDGLINKVK
mgnify:CR=1 FL=1